MHRNYSRLSRHYPPTRSARVSQSVVLRRGIPHLAAKTMAVINEFKRQGEDTEVLNLR